MSDQADPTRRLLPRRAFVLPLIAALLALGLFVALLLGFTRAPGSAGLPLIGSPAPDFLLDTADGNTLNLSDLRGELVLLNFWASWCVPCREEAPLLERAVNDYGARGLQVVGVLYQDGAEAARAFEGEYGLTYPSVLDPDGRTAIDFGVFGIPESFLVDRDGIIRDRQIGPYTADELRRKIERYLP